MTPMEYRDRDVPTKVFGFVVRVSGTLVFVVGSGPHWAMHQSNLNQFEPVKTSQGTRTSKLRISGDIGYLGLTQDPDL